MIYSSIEFLLTMPLFVAVYWLTRSFRGRQALILVGSLVFYAWPEPRYLVLLVGVIVFGWLAGLVVDRRRESPVPLTAAVVALLSLLCFFKYGSPALDLLRAYIPVPGRLTVLAATFPLGVSFFIFEVISYLADIKAGRIEAERSLFRFGLFISFFPHLIAGPIMRANDLLPQLATKKTWNHEQFFAGLRLFIGGFVKKVLIADTCASVADDVFHQVGAWNSASLWIGALAYAVQIYGDFSGYTDMGRGVAAMIGYRLPINFRMPYLASSPRDFWRRWHISLSSWLRDYLYKPLGGNRRGKTRTYINLMVTMVLGGMWHGSNWTFAVWGAYHGALLAVQRWLGDRRFAWAAPRALSIPFTFLLIVVGWVLFRANTFGDALTVLSGMFLPRSGQMLSADPVRTVLIAAAVLIGWMCLEEYAPVVRAKLAELGAVQGLVWGAASAGMFYLVPTAARTFIYFHF